EYEHDGRIEQPLPEHAAEHAADAADQNGDKHAQRYGAPATCAGSPERVNEAQPEGDEKTQEQSANARLADTCADILGYLGREKASEPPDQRRPAAAQRAVVDE